MNTTKMNRYKEYFGFKEEAFQKDLSVKKMLELTAMVGVRDRMEYVLYNSGIMVLTGDVGSGKSTSIRWSLSHFHPSEVLVLNVIAGGGSVNEFYKQLCWALDLDIRSASRGYLIKNFKETIKEIIKTKKQKILLVIDEANLLRAEIFAELHTITQFDKGLENSISIVLAGQANLLDKMTYRSSAPLRSRIISKCHLSAIDQTQMSEYLVHHLKIAGIKKNLYTDSAVTAIYQGSAGILRKANHVAKGGLIAAMSNDCISVGADHIRIASTEIM